MTRAALMAEADALRLIAEHLISQELGWLPGPFTASSMLQERGLLVPGLYFAIRSRANEWADGAIGFSTSEDEWALACLFMALECESEAAELKPPAKRPRSRSVRTLKNG